ncbi:PAS domain-containing hybrid sensor histidine kinase/response regulator [Synoicihabitans lomoniglobus]|uniref:histidine kinase n=1 Tax=Synoicihabitans lomoniglobus TaxID=2909285 RepID=A0AAF0I4N1_9BACT|nr:ATP-binding protein [Opitutaceae bacterium LMO-M01]WED66928.1 ATP-binding protein [Opitutaceae bacterium LMO-M01]
MGDLLQRKTAMIMALALSLAATLVALATDENLRERLGTTYWLLGLAIIGSILLVLAGYVWDRTLMIKLREINRTAKQQGGSRNFDADDEAETAYVLPDEPELEQGQDEIMGLARQIERMAQNLQKVEASYRGIVEDQVDLICRYRADGKITFVNSAFAKFYGQKRRQILGSVFPIFEQGYPTRDFQGNLPDKASFEVALTNHEGTPNAFMWTHRAIKSQSGALLEYQAVGHDIGARKQAEAALIEAKNAAESADRAKSEFLAVVSHEIRTPINAVIGFAKLMRETPLTADQIEYISNIHQSGMTLETLIADILDVSRLEAGQLEVKKTAFALRECMQEIQRSFGNVARDLGIDFSLKVDPGVPVIVNGDQGRLRQVLMNIIGNALKFTEHGSVSVSVSCSRGEDIPDSDQKQLRLFVSVTDTGIGIPENRVKELFKPFSQLDSSSTRRRGGTGLGLVISKRLCELMGGAISVESKLGQGSTFRFSLSLTYLRGDSQPPVAAPRVSPSPSPSAA